MSGLLSRGPSVAPTFAVLAVFWITERDSRTGRDCSTSCQNPIGRESPSCMSGKGVKAGFGIVDGEDVDVRKKDRGMSVLSTRKIMLFAGEPFSGSAA